MAKQKHIICLAPSFPIAARLIGKLVFGATTLFLCAAGAVAQTQEPSEFSDPAEQSTDPTLPPFAELTFANAVLEQQVIQDSEVLNPQLRSELVQWSMVVAERRTRLDSLPSNLGAFPPSTTTSDSALASAATPIDQPEGPADQVEPTDEPFWEPGFEPLPPTTRPAATIDRSAASVASSAGGLPPGATLANLAPSRAASTTPRPPSPTAVEMLEQMEQNGGRPPQFVALAFDGSLSLEMWEETLAFAQAHPVKWTYFISCVYFLSDDHKRTYRSPRNSRLGASNIGFGRERADVNTRLGYLLAAFDQGHEIGSHACGHFDGSRWDRGQWQLEFDQFMGAMVAAYQVNGFDGEPATWRQFMLDEIVGFRAPLLGANGALFEVLEAEGFRYDTSRVGSWNNWPTRRSGNFWDFPLASIPEPSSGRYILSMDYNFYANHSNASPQNDRSAEFERRMLDSYLNYFEHNYNGNRAPLHIGHHFSRWNAGAYWRALQRFAAEVCAKPEVICGVYEDLADFMDAQERRPGELARMQAGDFPPMQ